MAVFWVVVPCSLVEVSQRFGGTCCLHHQGDRPATQKTAIMELIMFLSASSVCTMTKIFQIKFVNLNEGREFMFYVMCQFLSFFCSFFVLFVLEKLLDLRFLQSWDCPVIIFGGCAGSTARPVRHARSLHRLLRFLGLAAQPPIILHAFGQYKSKLNVLCEFLHTKYVSSGGFENETF
jgi:hypothetical protein